MRPPLRLRDDPETPQGLRDDLERSSGPDPSYDIVAGLATFHALIGAKSAAAGIASKAALSGATHAASATEAGFSVASIAEAAAPLVTAKAGMLTGATATAAVAVKIAIGGALIAGAAMLGVRSSEPRVGSAAEARAS